MRPDDRPPELAELDLEVLHGLPLPPEWTYLEAEGGPEFVVRGPGRVRTLVHGLDPREVVRSAWCAWERQFTADQLLAGPPLPLPPGWRITLPPAGPLGLGADLCGQACVIARELGLSAYRLKGPGGQTLAGRTPDVIAAAWRRHQQRLQRAKRRQAVGVVGASAVVGLAVVFVLAALGCSPAVELTEPWYTAIMTTAPRNFILAPIATLLLAIMYACGGGDDGGEADCPTTPPAKPLAPFEVCVVDDDCEWPACLNGYCAEPCVAATGEQPPEWACINPESATCEQHIKDGQLIPGCVYSCSMDSDCPAIGKLALTCDGGTCRQLCEYK